MAQQKLVKVRDISKDEFGRPTELNGIERVITYAAFKYTTDKYELLAEVKQILDAKGNPALDANGDFIHEEVPGNPNLDPEYRIAISQKNVAHAADTRVEIQQPAPEVRERKKPGPKPKLPPVELQEHTA